MEEIFHIQLLGKKLDAEKQKELLAEKESSGLNAWLKFIDVDCTWKEDPKTGWAELIINNIN